MTRIVTTHYRYKRPPRKRKAIALEVPAIVAIPDKKQSRVLSRIDTSDAGKAAPPANDDRKPARTSSHNGTKSAIVIARNPLAATEALPTCPT